MLAVDAPREELPLLLVLVLVLVLELVLASLPSRRLVRSFPSLSARCTPSGSRDSSVV